MIWLPFASLATLPGDLISSGANEGWIHSLSSSWDNLAVLERIPSPFCLPDPREASGSRGHTLGQQQQTRPLILLCRPELADLGRSLAAWSRLPTGFCPFCPSARLWVPA